VRTFYSVLGTISFTLLGLWILVVQAHRAQWINSPDRRHMAYAIFLNFALPAAMSIFSLVNPENTLIWRISFCAAAVLGAVGVLMARGRAGTILGTGRWVAGFIYLAVAVVAFFAGSLAQLVANVEPLEVEAMLLSILVLLDLNLAWVFLLQD
jgi:hypothetical protein